MQVLLAEDDPVLGRALQIGLSSEGLSVDWTRNGVETVSICRRRPYAALILDLGLPDMGGFEILHQIRQFNSAVPVIVLTARGSVDDRIRGLEFGADDYVTKPFELSELVARLRAVRRRVGHEHDSVITVGDVSMDLRRHAVALNEQPVALTALEFALLRMLMGATAPVATCEAARQLYPWGDDIDEQTIVVCLRLLQAKLAMRLEQGDSGWRVQPHRTIH